MNYTSTPPQETGYYWLKTGDIEEIVEVWTNPDAPESGFWLHRCGDGDCAAMQSVASSLWAGPIPRPV